MVGQRSDQNAENDGNGLAEFRRQDEGQQLGLSPISARATMPVETRNAYINDTLGDVLTIEKKTARKETFRAVDLSPRECR